MTDAETIQFKEANYLLFKLKKYKEANEIYLRLIADNPDFIEAINNVAQNFRLNYKDFASALRYYDRVIELNPIFEHAYFRRGLCKEKLNDIDGHINDFTRHMEIVGVKPSLFVSRAIISFRAGHFQDVIEDCRIALAYGRDCYYADKLLQKALDKISAN